MSSRVEELLAAAVDGSGTDGLDPPQSRNEKLLFALNDKLDNVKSALAGKVDGPADGQAYQQLVTDGDGNTKWEDRLAYEVPEQWKLFTPDDAVELAACCSREAYDAGKTFRVVIDGQVFDDVPVVEYYSAGRVYGIGEPINDSNPVWSDDGCGFLIRATLTVAYNPNKFSSKPKVFTDTFVYELVSPSNIKQIDPKFLPVTDSSVIFWISYDSLGSPTVSCNCSYEELKSFCINKSVPILGSLFDENKVKQLTYIIYNEDDASIYLQFYSGEPGNILQLEYKQNGSIGIMPV